MPNITFAEFVAYQRRCREAKRPLTAPPAPKPAAPPPSAGVVVRETTDERRLNKTEHQWLACLRATEVQHIGIQNVTLKLADDCRYTPDFTGIEDGVRTAWEVKGGFFREDAQVKLKVAARLYAHLFRFVLVRKESGGRWNVTEVKP